MVSRGISDVAIASVHSEKTRLMKLLTIIIIIIRVITINNGFSGHQKLTSAMKLRPEKCV